MTLRGDVISAAAKNGVGAYIDISSPLDIWITGPDAKLPKVAKDESAPLVLDASRLSSYGAESLLIGGIRTETDDGTNRCCKNRKHRCGQCRSPLTGPEVILAANESLTLAPRASVQQAGAMRSDAQRLQIEGDGTLLRVSSDPMATISRTKVTGADNVRMTIARRLELQARA